MIFCALESYTCPISDPTDTMHVNFAGLSELSELSELIMEYISLFISDHHSPFAYLIHAFSYEEASSSSSLSSSSLVNEITES